MSNIFEKNERNLHNLMELFCQDFKLYQSEVKEWLNDHDMEITEFKNLKKE